MISLIHPSRERFDRAFGTFFDWMDSSSKEIDIQHIISVDESDPCLENYKNKFGQSTLVIGNNTCAVEAINHGAKYALGEIIIVISDDFRCFKNWDKKIKEVFDEAGSLDKIIKTNDGTQPWIITLPILGTDFYERQGYIYNPEYKHMFCDTELTHRADLEDKIIYRNDIHFHHDHYSTGASEPDAVSRKADLTWNQGQEVYLNNVQNHFGLQLPADKTVFDIKLPEGQGHIQWLKSKFAL